MLYNEELKTYHHRKSESANKLIDVEIGDAKQPSDFYPQAKFLYWNNECNFSLRLSDDSPTLGTHSYSDGVVLWQRGGRKARFYNMANGDFEFEVEYDSKPDINTVSFTITTKELDFFYQPELTPEEIAEGCIRPAEIVGSYAVYHKSKNGKILGGKSYLNGKAFHIYRPWAQDAENTKVWCDLSIDTENNLLTITIPQDFLDSAVYPVLVDPTFGVTTIGGTTSGASSTQPFSLPAALTEDGSITTISVYCTKGSSGTTPLGAAIYSNSSGYPNVLLAQDSGDTSVGNTTQWWDVSISYSATAATYHLAWWMQEGTYYYDTGSVGMNLRTLQTFQNWPDPFGTPVSFNRKYSTYATYTTGGGGSSIKTFNNLAYASTKTVNSLAVASVKTWNSLA